MSTKNPFDLVGPKSTVVGTGLIALDVVISHNEPQSLQHWAGGTCGNVLTILSYLGWESYPVARLNGDKASKCISKDLKRWSVHLEFATSKPTADTPIIIQKISRNSIGEVFHRFSLSCPYCGASLPTYKPVLASAAEVIATRLSSPNVFFFDRVSRGSIILAKASSESGAIIVFEPSGVGDPQLFREALALTHILKYSNERMSQLSELVPSARPLIEIQTLGKEGLRYRSKTTSCKINGWQHLDAYKIEQVKDTSGAGDWCTAGIIHRLGQEGFAEFKKISPGKLHDAIRFGQALSAWNCGFEGARGGMYIANQKKFREDVVEIMSQKRQQQIVNKINNVSIQPIKPSQARAACCF
jgi:sugar/nucleoside kinase (ribokinase family)